MQEGENCSSEPGDPITDLLGGSSIRSLKKELPEREIGIGICAKQKGLVKDDWLDRCER